MFPLKPRDELVFGISNNSTPSSQNIPSFPVNNNLVDDHAKHNFQFSNASTTSTTISFTNNSTTKKPRTRPESRGRDQAEIMSKKAMHRNIERQRREQMAQLYSSLRSLLPLHHIKGKHSLSDLMHESKDYINKLQNNVQELQTRRDKIKKLSYSTSSTEISSSNGSKNRTNNHVEVNKEQDGTEILISTSSSEFELSLVMKELMINDLDVVSSVSTKINGRFLHKIHAEASDLNPVDHSKLQERLTNVIN